MANGFYSVLTEVLNMVFMAFTKGFLALFDLFFGGIGQGLSLAWENPIMDVFMIIANIFSISVLSCSLLFFFLKIGQEEKRNWYIIFKCFFNTMLFIAFNQLIVKTCFLIPDLLVTGLNNALDGFVPSTLLDVSALLLGPFQSIIVVVALLGFMYITIMRFGMMFIQIMVAPFYVPFIITGDSQKPSEWMLSTVTAGFTYLIQYMIFYAGLLTVSFAGEDFWLLLSGIAIMFITFKVSAVMQKLGYSAGGGSVLNSAYMGANMISSLLKR